MASDDLEQLLRGESPKAARAGSPSDSASPPRDLGESHLVRRLSRRPKYLFGKWCSPCRGIWYGLTLECECPRCGNRHG